MQLQNLSSCPNLIPRKEPPNSATLKIPPLIVPGTMNNIASTAQSSTAKRNIFSELEDDEDDQPRGKIFPARSSSLNVIPSLFLKKPDNERDNSTRNSQVAHKLDFSDKPMAFASRSDHVQSASHKPVARNLFSEIDDEDTSTQEFLKPSSSLLRSEQKSPQLHLPSGFSFEGCNNAQSGSSTPLNVSYLSTKILNLKSVNPLPPDYCRSAMLQSKGSRNLFSENDEETPKMQNKPINLIQIKSLPHPSRSASENNLPFLSNKYNNPLKPMELQTSQQASRVLDFEDNDNELETNSQNRAFTFGQSASAMLKPKNLFSEVGEEEQQLIQQPPRINKSNFTIGRCCSENNIPSNFSRLYQRDNGSVCPPDSSNSWTMLKALSFDSDDNVETVQENNTSTQGTNKVSIEMQPHFLPPSGYLKVEKISSSPISVGYQYGEHIFNQRNDYRPNFPSQFAPLNSNKFQRSATEIISPGLRTGNKNKTFISERDVSFVTDEPLSRFEHDFEVLEVRKV